MKLRLYLARPNHSEKKKNQGTTSEKANIPRRCLKVQIYIQVKKYEIVLNMMPKQWFVQSKKLSNKKIYNNINIIYNNIKDQLN